MSIFINNKYTLWYINIIRKAQSRYILKGYIEPKRVHTDETKEKIRNALLGKKKTEEHKQNLRKPKKKR
tara:strand:- start:8577 stop:8783 length:207 start_codon:yes stop_codon:yes gene_type:complete